MEKQDFERILDAVCAELTAEARVAKFDSSKAFENRVREIVQAVVNDPSIPINFDPHPQAFPDIAVGEFGIEVKFTTNDTWRSVANSVLERNRIDEVKTVYLVFGNMGAAEPEAKWGEYEKCVMHVRTSHVPRFEVELFPDMSLFDRMGISYDEFRSSEMEDKMRHIRHYARGRLKKGERLWWLEDTPEPEHALPIAAKLYTHLPSEDKICLRAEAVLICPEIVQGSRARDKYDGVALYLLTYHGVLCHQARDLFSAGSVGNPKNDDEGGIYIERALLLLQEEILAAASRLDDAVFEEYWGESVAPQDRIARWLEKADTLARDWVPSRSLFLEYQSERLKNGGRKGA